MKTENIVFLDRLADPYLIPIGTKGENDVTTVVFDFTDNIETVLLETAAPILYVFRGSVLIEETSEFEQLESNKFALPVTEQLTATAGQLTANIKFVNASGAIWCSENFTLFVADREDGDGQVVEQMEPSIIVQMKAAAETVNQNLENIVENREATETARDQSEVFAAGAEAAKDIATEQAGISTTHAVLGLILRLLIKTLRIPTKRLQNSSSKLRNKKPQNQPSKHC